MLKSALDLPRPNLLLWQAYDSGHPIINRTSYKHCSRVNVSVQQGYLSFQLSLICHTFQLSEAKSHHICQLLYRILRN